jgi:hypothetical protein
MMAVSIGVGSPVAHSIDFAVSGTHQGCFQDHLAVYVRSWIDVGGRRNMDNLYGVIVCKDPCQYGEECEKD